MTKIAFLGLGAMGSRMARRLLSAGHDLTIWNRTAPSQADWPSARIAATPREAASGADIVITMVRDDAAASDVWLNAQTGALAGMRAGALAIDCSTVSAKWARTLHTACAAESIDCLDAPVVGSRPQAEAGALIFLAGGSEVALGHARPTMAIMGSMVHHAGGPGSGAAVKLLINALFGVQVAAIAELLGLADAQGLDPARVSAIIGETPVASPALKGAMSSMLADAFAPMFPIDLVAKDFTLIRHVIESGSALAPITSSAGTVFDNAQAAGLGAENLTAVAKIYR